MDCQGNRRLATGRLPFARALPITARMAAPSQPSFTVDGNLDTLLGKIAAIEPGADAMTHTVRARAIVPNPAGKLVAGSFAHVTIPFGTSGQSLMIPSQAVIPTTRDKKVAVVRSGKAELVTVVTGDRTADQVQILSGLNAGDTVMITALMQVKTGLDVTVQVKAPGEK